MAHTGRRLAALAAAGALTLAAGSCSRVAAGPVPSVAPTAPAAAPGDFAGLVDIGGGRSLYLECHGTGSPTVVMQSGFGNAGDIWSLAEAHPPAVAPGVAAFTRVCAYDRPGSLITTTSTGGAVTSAPSPAAGRSTPVPPMPRDPAELVAELHKLLAVAGEPGPYVLVGHSLGGALSQLYARTHPDQVSGMVLVDAGAPAHRAAQSPQLFEKGRYPALAPDTVPGYRTEAYDLGAVYDQIEAAPPLRAMPVVVLSSSDLALPDPMPSPYAATEGADLERAWRAGQDGLAAGIPGAEHVTVPGTSHYVQNQRPDAVIQAVREVLTRASSPRPTGS
ncbi:alpha/beta fold hydrolase [Catellatospora chokoriensis]|uniref:Alpha/beta hydrolase n=1 Tax=Catellatospora chokoriensis TaxID=310353 RepID=A0A8J3NU56_9ACTN|nr:alpha/beta hydrolase [Catellatospora chokoriensis]GIF90890.1 alpha/beta hydrolase [Catellatospora chokoriensis]